ncbi:MAG: hypothetical protein LBI77_02760 [Puniceicoccales bacterium]|jgi:hypothetical protein|nr:hypothetical protein [Puniceicoccales bacterium]
MNKKSIFSFCLFWPFVSFGVLINNKNILVTNKRDMNKIYRETRPMILKGEFKAAAFILAKAYREYASHKNGFNIKKDLRGQENPYWMYLESAVKYHRNFSAKDSTPEFAAFQQMVVNSIKITFPWIVQTD